MFQVVEDREHARLLRYEGNGQYGELLFLSFLPCRHAAFVIAGAGESRKLLHEPGIARAYPSRAIEDNRLRGLDPMLLQQFFQLGGRERTPVFSRVEIFPRDTDCPWNSSFQPFQGGAYVNNGQ